MGWGQAFHIGHTITIKVGGRETKAVFIKYIIDEGIVSGLVYHLPCFLLICWHGTMHKVVHDGVYLAWFSKEGLYLKDLMILSIDASVR